MFVKIVTSWSTSRRKRVTILWTILKFCPDYVEMPATQDPSTCEHGPNSYFPDIEAFCCTCCAMEIPRDEVPAEAREELLALAAAQDASNAGRDRSVSAVEERVFKAVWQSMQTLANAENKPGPLA
jgi:nucleotide-binding universal stress UspA family protein